MALKTQGFALSALPRAPRIPGNVGVVDVKAIYDGVKQGLDAFETARRAPRSMLLADAQMQAATEQAPLATRGVLAQTEAAEQQLPIRTALLAAEASPEMQEAKRQALLARSVRQPSGDVQLATALAAAKLRLSEDPTDAEAAQLVSVLEPMAVRKSAASMANPQGVIDAGIQRTADTNATRETIAAGANEVRTDIAAANNAAREAIAAQERESREKIAAGQAATRAALATAKAESEKAKIAVVAKAKMDALETRTDIVERAISEAIPQIGLFTAGTLGSPLSMIPGTPAKNVRRLLDAVKANIGFEELNNLRAQSPTGGALGQVTERELGFLQSVLGSMEQDQSPSQLKSTLETILARFRELRDERREAFANDFGAPEQPSATTPAPASADQFEVGKEYTDASGNKAIYRGNGNWEEIQ